MFLDSGLSELSETFDRSYLPELDLNRDAASWGSATVRHGVRHFVIQLEHSSEGRSLLHKLRVHRREAAVFADELLHDAALADRLLRSTSDPKVHDRETPAQRALMLIAESRRSACFPTLRRYAFVLDSGTRSEAIRLAASIATPECIDLALMCLRTGELSDVRAVCDGLRFADRRKRLDADAKERWFTVLAERLDSEFSVHELLLQLDAIRAVVAFEHAGHLAHGHPSFRAAMQAMSSVWTWPPAEDIPELLANLPKDTLYIDRICYLSHLLGEFRDPDQLPLLMIPIDNDSTGAGDAATWVLEMLGVDCAIARAGATKSDAAQDFAAGMRALFALEAELACHGLHEWLGDEDAANQALVVAALKAHGDSDQAAALELARDRFAALPDDALYDPGRYLDLERRLANEGPPLRVVMVRVALAHRTEIAELLR